MHRSFACIHSFKVHCIIYCRFLGAAVGAGKSPTFKQCARGYKFMRRTWDLKINLKPLRGSMANLEKMMIDYDSNIMLYTTEGKLELLMAASSSQDKKNTSHTAYDVACTLFNDGEGAKEELSSSGVSFSRQLVVLSHSPPLRTPLTHQWTPKIHANRTFIWDPVHTFVCCEQFDPNVGKLVMDQCPGLWSRMKDLIDTSNAGGKLLTCFESWYHNKIIMPTCLHAPHRPQRASVF